MARRDAGLACDDVARVTIRLAPNVAAVVDDREIPNICLQHMVAVMLLDGTVTFAAAHDEARMQDPATSSERAKVDLVHDAALDAFLPVRVAIVEIELNDGTRLSERVEAVRGTPRNPMSRDEVIDKVARFVARVADCGSFARARRSSGRAADIVDAATAGARSGVGDAAVFEHRRPKGLAGPMQANGCVVLSDVEPNGRLAEFKTVRVHQTQD